MDKDRAETLAALGSVVFAGLAIAYVVFWGERAHRLLERNVDELAASAKHQAAVAAMVPRAVYDPAEDI